MLNPAFHTRITGLPIYHPDYLPLSCFFTSSYPHRNQDLLVEDLMTSNITQNMAHVSRSNAAGMGRNEREHSRGTEENRSRSLHSARRGG